MIRLLLRIDKVLDLLLHYQLLLLYLQLTSVMVSLFAFDDDRVDVSSCSITDTSGTSGL